MALTRKVLWIVNMNTDAAETAFAKHALACGANTVCIRTSSKRLPGAVARFKELGMSVYAWRWPSVIPARTRAEADLVAKELIPAGLGGYIVDPESDGPGSNDWNQEGLDDLAEQFCSTIRTAARGKSFVLGTTSGCTYPSARGKPDIPWATFFSASDILLPQTYWRWTNSTGKVQDINGGTPGKAIQSGLNAWKSKADGKPILPMAGEIDVITPDEIARYGAKLSSLGVAEAHFYTDNGKIPVRNLAAVQAL
jgi:hypothetical protein